MPPQILGPGSPIPKSICQNSYQKVNILMKTKNAPKDLKCKIKHTFFFGNRDSEKGGRGGPTLKKNSQKIPFFFWGGVPKEGYHRKRLLGDGGTKTGVTQSKFFLAPSFIGPFFAARFASISFCLSAFFSSLRFLASSLEFIELELVSPQSFPQESEELVSVVVTGLSAECDFTPLLKLIVEAAE